MAKDDFYVIAYKILAYLYMQLKNGEPIDPDMIKNDSPLFQINQRYWSYIMRNLLDEGYITGGIYHTACGKDRVIHGDLSRVEITPKGIDYLCENTALERAKQFLKDIKEITPFI